MNFWMGCTKCAPECVHCYIPFGTGFGKRDPWADVYLPTTTWNKPRLWQREIPASATLPNEDAIYKRVFTCSLSDFFHPAVDKRLMPSVVKPVSTVKLVQDTVDFEGRSDVTWRDCAWQAIRSTPNLVWLVLTKRPELIADRLPKDWPLQNVWLGVSTGCKQTLKKVDILRQTPMHEKAVRFISAEPLLEDIADDLDLTGIGWLITGGESGHGDEYLYNPATWSRRIKSGDDSGRRTMRLKWAQNLLMLARFHDVPFWFKQVTAPESGAKPDALGQIYYEVPPPPFGKWATKSTRVTKETI